MVGGQDVEEDQRHWLGRRRSLVALVAGQVPVIGIFGKVIEIEIDRVGGAADAFRRQRSDISVPSDVGSRRCVMLSRSTRPVYWSLREIDQRHD